MWASLTPLWIDMPPYNSSGFVGFAAESRSVYSNFGVQHLGTDCLAVHGGSPDTAWKCIVGEYRLPFVKTPYLVVASQYDEYQLGKNHIWPINTPSSKRAYASELARRTATAMRALRATWPLHAAKQNAVFSWSCNEHATSMARFGFDYQTCGRNSITLGAAFRQFLEQKPFSINKTDLMWVETCEGFSCGPGCSRVLDLFRLLVFGDCCYFQLIVGIVLICLVCFLPPVCQRCSNSNETYDELSVLPVMSVGNVVNTYHLVEFLQQSPAEHRKNSQDGFV